MISVCIRQHNNLNAADGKLRKSILTKHVLIKALPEYSPAAPKIIIRDNSYQEKCIFSAAC